ncbi:Reverse transcriptase domain-containing protein [Mycena venus]|uniref:Reverse transcriptase domain-containing protein n=1 Tax=Mycena venus TaxID=2733690 RepID=A0A8H7CUW7_9AGAR|nr:Reverse transcriptase domain-containing protein [Mycena venus]
MDNPRYLPLFSPRQRAHYAARARSPTPPPWNGIGVETFDPSDSASDSGNESDAPNPTPQPHAATEPDAERNAEMELLKSLPPAALAKAIGSLFNNGAHEPTSVHNTHPATASNSRKRPPRTPGLAASNAGYLIPEAIRKKFEQGWKSIVPLHFLTDKFCAHSNLAAAKELNDIFLVDSSSGSMAWGRLLELIETYLPEEHEMWPTHFNSILHRPHRAQNWSLCLEYDSEVRRRALNSSIDPAVFHSDIWGHLESAHIAKRAYDLVRREAQNTGRPGRSNTDSDRSQGTGGGRYQPYDSKCGNSDSNHSFRTNGKLRCFTCGTTEDYHKSRNCSADRLVNGKPTILVFAGPGVPRRDRDGIAYCYAFNGFAGCSRGPDCDRGKHWCSLWEAALKAANAHRLFFDIPIGLREGFHMGIHSAINETYTPPNHSSALSHPTVIEDYINKERAGGRYTGPFSRSRLETLIGPFRTSPLGTVPKAGSPDEHRIVQDFSFPRNDPLRSSINSEIDTDDFQCEWGTFSEVVLLVMDAPPGTEAATLDVDAAYRRCPIHPSQQAFFVIQWMDKFYIDHVCPFGSASSGGVFGRLADAISAIFIANDIGPLNKWVDDFLFFRYRVSDNPSTFTYDLDDIYALAEFLGWPWKRSKTRPFATLFKYIGFLWDLVHKTIQIPDDKKSRYLEKLAPWVDGATFTCKEAESVLGTLVHCSLAIPEGRSRLPSISKFASSFPHNASRFSRRTPNTTVLADIAWWRDQLSRSFCGSKLVRPPTVSPKEFWVDASTSWGIGIVFDGIWQRWKLLPGWHADERGIGWAEMVAIEFGLRFAIHKGYCNVHFQIRSDNEGVIGALAAGKSRNSEQNRVLRRIVALMRSHSIWVSTFYIRLLTDILAPFWACWLGDKLTRSNKARN